MMAFLISLSGNSEKTTELGHIAFKSGPKCSLPAHKLHFLPGSSLQGPSHYTFLEFL